MIADGNTYEKIRKGHQWDAIITLLGRVGLIITPPYYTSTKLGALLFRHALDIGIQSITINSMVIVMIMITNNNTDHIDSIKVIRIIIILL